MRNIPAWYSLQMVSSPCLSVGVSSALLTIRAGPKYNLNDGHLVHENFPSILPYPANYYIPSPSFFPLSLRLLFFSFSFFFFRSSRGGMWRERAILRNPGDREFHKASTFPLARSPGGFSPAPAPHAKPDNETPSDFPSSVTAYAARACAKRPGPPLDKLFQNSLGF